MTSPRHRPAGACATARRAASAVLALAALVLTVAATLAVAGVGVAGAQTPTSPPPTSAPATATTPPTSAAPATTSPTTSPTTAPTGEVDTGTVPGAEDGTGKALLIGGAFIAIIVVGALIAKAASKPGDEGSAPVSAPVDGPADERPPAPDHPVDERTHGWADEPAAESASEPATRPLLFDQDQTDGHGRPVSGPSGREHR